MCGEHSAHLLKEKGGVRIRAASRITVRFLMSAETEVPSCMRGYHVYKDRCAAAFDVL